MFSTQQIEAANTISKGSLQEHLGIRFVPSAPGTFAATMPVDARTHQPMGMLHGGATAALAETLGSTGSYMLIDMDTQAVVGIEVNANHLKGVRSGTVLATGTMVHKGRTTHVWDIRVTDEQGSLVAVCRLTNLIIARAR
ncbi:MAG: hotdog fold thioesterase [Flavobacteriales bacterium]|nr:hotdog fold thioesterase [Flavobacteriales bacterium]MBK7556009.1 hotdog fold thioesterase [Flavobacteriales bacterium]MBK9194028.1 hotdog fold thioesterase [Flavobacteriales bacterium]